MKHIYRLLASALVLFTAAACYNQEIEGPQNPDKQHSDFRITASIVKTRVSYQDDIFGGYLELEWEDGDVLFGYIESEPKIQIELKVDGDPDTDGVATLVAASGSEDALSSLTEGDIVDLVYTGQAASYDQGDSSITVDMTRQSGQGKIPACMHARGVVTEDNGSKCLDFHFVNDCAIFEVESLTGMAKGTLSTISITNLFPEGKYTLGDEGFSFVGNGTIGTYTYTCGESWGVETGGVVTYGDNVHPLLIAVAPNPEAKAITVEAKVINGGNPMTKSFDYGAKSIAGGSCYVISAQPYVAMTVDGMCHRSVKEAFDHAEKLNDDNLLCGKPNIVTLIKDQIDGLGEHPDKAYIEDGEDSYWDASLMVEIDYDVTLDLNGCTLSLSGYKEWDYGDEEDDDDDDLLSDNTEYFYVCSGGDFTITDSKGPNSEGIYSGTITSSSDTHMIKSKSGSQITINGGSFEHTYEWCIVSNYGELNVLAGDLSSNYAVVDNYGTLKVSEENNLRKVNMVSKPISGDFATVYNNDAAEIYIYDGTTIEGTNGATIYNYRGTINIHGGSISSDNNNAIDSRMYEIQNGSIKGGLINNDTYYKLLPKVNIFHGTLTTTYGAAVIQNEGYVCLADNNDITISGGNCHAIINNGILEINNGTISSNGFTPTEQEDDDEDAGEYRAAIFSLDNFPTDTYPCETSINGGKITSETTDAIYIASADESYSGQKFTFYMTGGDIEGETYGINFFSYDSKSDSITFPESYQINTEGTEITFTNGSTIKGGTSAINGYSLP